MQRAIMLLLLLLGGCFLAQPALADGRVALVIGNSKYQHAPYLPNPVNDAHDVAASFERLGFSVRLVTDANFDAMRRALLDFAPQAQGADIAVVFFAGHGMEIRDENWLVPVDAEIKLNTATGQEAISLASIMPIVAATKKLGLVMLDACRDNPFSLPLETSQRSLGTRGLAAVEPPNSVLVMFAARHGTTASDGAGRNSPFSTALLHNLEAPGLEINYLFRNVHDEVSNATNGRQEPFVYGTLSKTPIFLKPTAEATSAAPGAPASVSEAGQAWASIKDTSDRATLQAFIESFNSSFYATLARNRLHDLALDDAPKASVSSAPSPSTSAPPSAAGTSAAADGAKAPQPDTAGQITGAWTWHARCGLVGNFNGTLMMSQVAPGQLRFNASDGWSEAIGQIHGTAVSMQRHNGEGAVQHLSLQLSSPAGGRARLSGGFTDSRIPLGSCPFSAVHG